MFKKIINTIIIGLLISNLCAGCTNNTINEKEKIEFEPTKMQSLFSEVSTYMQKQEIFDLCNVYIELDDYDYIGKPGEYGIDYEDYDTDKYEIQVSEGMGRKVSIWIIDKKTKEEVQIIHDWDYSERGYHTEAIYRNRKNKYNVYLSNTYDGVDGPSDYFYSVQDAKENSYGNERFDEEHNFGTAEKAFNHIYNNI